MNYIQKNNHRDYFSFWFIPLFTLCSKMNVSLLFCMRDVNANVGGTSILIVNGVSKMFVHRKESAFVNTKNRKNE